MGSVLGVHEYRRGSDRSISGWVASRVTTMLLPRDELHYRPVEDPAVSMGLLAAKNVCWDKQLR